MVITSILLLVGATAISARYTFGNIDESCPREPRFGTKHLNITITQCLQWGEQPVCQKPVKYQVPRGEEARCQVFNALPDINSNKIDFNKISFEKHEEPMLVVTATADHVIYPPPPKKKNCGGGNKTEGSNTIMSTSFALIFWSNKIIDVDIILSITLTVS